MNHKLTIIFLSIVFSCSFAFATNSQLLAFEESSFGSPLNEVIQSKTICTNSSNKPHLNDNSSILPLNFNIMEQEYGGELVSFPEIQKYFNTHSSISIVFLDDSRKEAIAFPEEIIAITRGILYEVENSKELESLIKKGIEAITCGQGHAKRIYLEKIEQPELDPEFIRLMKPLWNTKAPYMKLIEGYELCQMEKYQEALCLAEDLLKDLSDEPHLLGLLAKASVGVGNCPGALIELKKALRLNPRYYNFYLQRGLLFLKLNVVDGARIDLEESLKFYPTQEAYQNLGKIGLLEENYFDAMENFSHVLDLSFKKLSNAAEVMAYPDKALEISTTLTPLGYLAIEAKNKTNFSLSHVVVSIENSEYQKSIQFGNQEIKPNKSMKFLTSVGPFKQNSDPYLALNLTVGSIRVVDKCI